MHRLRMRFRGGLSEVHAPLRYVEEGPIHNRSLCHMAVLITSRPLVLRRNFTFVFEQIDMEGHFEFYGRLFL
jgi:hypothetical protein